ncbi:MAG TPA: hypothetical protein VMB26_11605 [Candidatus Binataceae bacterium]|nr:hypothetical protein [Candidatus Binataceae bacterium]
MFKKVLMLAISGGLFTVLTYCGAARAAGLGGNYVVQASGTAYFFTCQSSDVSCTSYPLFGQGTTEVLHFTMAGSASFVNGKNTAVNLTLNLGGEDDNSTQAQNDTNELICYLNQPGDLFYTPAAGNSPAMLTVTYQYNNGKGDKCIGPNGLPVGGVYEQGDVLPFNFYPYGPATSGGVLISNYTYLTTGGTNIGSNPNGWKDGGYPDSHVVTGLSVSGQLTGGPNP